MIKGNIFMISILILATALGILAEDVYYFFTDVLEYSHAFGARAFVLSTTSSWFLYIGAFLLVLW